MAFGIRDRDKVRIAVVSVLRNMAQGVGNLAELVRWVVGVTRHVLIGVRESDHVAVMVVDECGSVAQRVDDAC